MSCQYNKFLFCFASTILLCQSLIPTEITKFGQTALSNQEQSANYEFLSLEESVGTFNTISKTVNLYQKVFDVLCDALVLDGINEVPLSESYQPNGQYQPKTSDIKVNLSKLGKAIKFDAKTNQLSLNFVAENDPINIDMLTSGQQNSQKLLQYGSSKDLVPRGIQTKANTTTRSRFAIQNVESNVETGQPYEKALVPIKPKQKSYYVDKNAMINAFDRAHTGQFMQFSQSQNEVVPYKKKGPLIEEVDDDQEASQSHVALKSKYKSEKMPKIEEVENEDDIEYAIPVKKDMFEKIVKEKQRNIPYFKITYDEATKSVNMRINIDNPIENPSTIIQTLNLLSRHILYDGIVLTEKHVDQVLAYIEKKTFIAAKDCLAYKNYDYRNYKDELWRNIDRLKQEILIAVKLISNYPQQYCDKYTLINIICRNLYFMDSLDGYYSSFSDIESVRKKILKIVDASLLENHWNVHKNDRTPKNFDKLTESDYDWYFKEAIARAGYIKDGKFKGYSGDSDNLGFINQKTKLLKCNKELREELYDAMFSNSIVNQGQEQLCQDLLKMLIMQKVFENRIQNYEDIENQTKERLKKENDTDDKKEKYTDLFRSHQYNVLLQKIITLYIETCNKINESIFDPRKENVKRLINKLMDTLPVDVKNNQLRCFLETLSNDSRVPEDVKKFINDKIKTIKTDRKAAITYNGETNPKGIEKRLGLGDLRKNDLNLQTRELTVFKNNIDNEVDSNLLDICKEFSDIFPTTRTTYTFKDLIEYICNYVGILLKNLWSSTTSNVNGSSGYRYINDLERATEFSDQMSKLLPKKYRDNSNFFIIRQGRLIVGEFEKEKCYIDPGYIDNAKYRKNITPKDTKKDIQDHIKYLYSNTRAQTTFRGSTDAIQTYSLSEQPDFDNIIYSGYGYERGLETFAFIDLNKLYIQLLGYLNVMLADYKTTSSTQLDVKSQDNNFSTNISKIFDMMKFIKNYSDTGLKLSDEQKKCAVKIALEIMNNIGTIKTFRYLDQLTVALTPDLRQILKEEYPTFYLPALITVFTDTTKIDKGNRLLERENKAIEGLIQREKKTIDVKAAFDDAKDITENYMTQDDDQESVDDFDCDDILMFSDDC